MTMMACPFCASAGQVRLDRRSRPYWSCTGCATRVFMHTDVGFLGFSLISGMVGSLGKDRWAGELARARGVVNVPIAVAPEAVAVPSPITAVSKDANPNTPEVRDAAAAVADHRK